MVLLLILLLTILLIRLNLKKNNSETGNNDTKNVEIMVPLKYLSNFWRTLAMPVINCKINFILTCFANCIISSNTAANQPAAFGITDIKLYTPVVTLSTQDNGKTITAIEFRI